MNTQVSKRLFPYEPHYYFYCKKCGRRSWISWGMQFAYVKTGGPFCARCRREELKRIK